MVADDGGDVTGFVLKIGTARTQVLELPLSGNLQEFTKGDLENNTEYW